MSGTERHEDGSGIAGAIICAFLLTAMLFIPAGSVNAVQTCYDGGLIIAHADPEYSEGGGTWAVGSGSWDTCALDFRPGWRTTSTVGAWAKWTPAISRAGKYRVLFWIPERHAGGRCAIEVHYSGGMKKISRDTKVAPLGWWTLGDYDFAAGKTGSVLATNAQGKIGVDAVKFISTNNLAEIKLRPYPEPDGSVPRVDKLGGGHIVVCGQKRLIHYGEVYEPYKADDIPYFGDACDTWLRQGLNTIAMTLAWNDVEPAKDRYDTRMIEAMVDACKARNMHLIIVWFGTWRNLQSNYVPGYIGQQKIGYPDGTWDRNTGCLAVKKDGKVENGGVSPFATKVAERDGLALNAMLGAGAKKDPGHQVLIGVQVENEMPCCADYSPAANEHINEQVPKELIDYLKANDTLKYDPSKLGWFTYNRWHSYGKSGTTGKWSQLFGMRDGGNEQEGRQAMGAYYTGKYIEIVVRKAKEALNIPMYANAWCGASPCDSNFMDIFHVGCPSLDGMGPDNPDWEGYVRVNYRRPWNSLVNPEFFCHENTFEAIADGAFLYGTYFQNEFEMSNVRWIYPIVSQMEPLIVEKRYDGTLLGFGQHAEAWGAAEHSNVGDTWENNYQDMIVKCITVTTAGGQDINHYNTSGPILHGNGLIMKMGADDYVVTSTKIDVELRYADGRPMRVSRAERGHFEKGRWVKDGPAEIDGTRTSAKLQFPTENWKYGQVRLNLPPIMKDPTQPTQPSNLRATAQSVDRIALSWSESKDPDSGVAFYRVLRDGAEIATTRQTRYVDAGLAECTSYGYEVAAVNGGLTESKHASVKMATLTDKTPPQLERASAIVSTTNVRAFFSEPLEPVSAGEPGNYAIGGGVTVRGAKVSEDGRMVRLETSALSEGVEYALTVEKVRDRARTPNALAKPARVNFRYADRGDGLLGRYYANTELKGDPAVERIDAQIDYRGGAPFKGKIGAEKFSVRWTGSICAPRAGRYTLYLTHDDGVRLWVDGVQLIDGWKSLGESNAEVNLDGALHPIRIEYFQGGGGASAKFEWSGPGVSRQTVPTEFLGSLEKRRQGAATDAATGVKGDGGAPKNPQN